MTAHSLPELKQRLTARLCVDGSIQKASCQGRGLRSSGDIAEQMKALDSGFRLGLNESRCPRYVNLASEAWLASIARLLRLGSLHELQAMCQIAGPHEAGRRVLDISCTGGSLHHRVHFQRCLNVPKGSKLQASPMSLAEGLWELWELSFC